jgi:hypothetical protein
MIIPLTGWFKCLKLIRAKNILLLVADQPKKGISDSI